MGVLLMVVLDVWSKGLFNTWIHYCVLYEPRHDKTNKVSVRPAKTQISLGIRPVWSESSLCAQWVAKDPRFLHADSEDSDQTGRMPRLIWVFAGRTLTLLVLSCRGSNRREFTARDTLHKNSTNRIFPEISSLSVLIEYVKNKLGHRTNIDHYQVFVEGQNGFVSCVLIWERSVFLTDSNAFSVLKLF